MLLKVLSASRLLKDAAFTVENVNGLKTSKTRGRSHGPFIPLMRRSEEDQLLIEVI